MRIPTRIPFLPLVLLSLLAASPAALPAQASPGISPADSISGALFDELARMDSLVFHSSFVACDTSRTLSYFTEDAEFYHDLDGLKTGDALRASLRNCPRDQGVRRVLVDGSLRVFPIHDYGAVQMGTHRFVNADGSTGGIARFVHVWQRTAGGWKVSRVLSIDHQPDPS